MSSSQLGEGEITFFHCDFVITLQLYYATFMHHSGALHLLKWKLAVDIENSFKHPGLLLFQATRWLHHDGHLVRVPAVMGFVISTMCP